MTTFRSLARGIVCALAVIPFASGRAEGQRGFPEAWAGQWTGTLTTYAPPDSVRNRVPVSLLIAREPAGNAWTWRTIFNADSVRGLRDYRLLVRDVSKGWYATDERNGVILEDTFIDGVLISVFQVGEQVLENRMSLRGDTLTQDIIFWSSKPSATSKGSGANAEGGVPITSHRIQGRQLMKFTRR